jgi:hypothetical protein
LDKDLKESKVIGVKNKINTEANDISKKPQNFFGTVPLKVRANITPANSNVFGWLSVPKGNIWTYGKKANIINRI